MNDMLILVDEDDNEIGYEEKMAAHCKEHLHRAFSLFIYDTRERKILIHKRARDKYHSGGLWTNSCCSHPRKGEELKHAVVRRVREELGIELNNYCDMEKVLELGAFQYYKKYNTCAEHEIDHVFIAPVTEFIPIQFDVSEIEEVKWISLDELKQCTENYPNTFTAWFPQAYGIVINYLETVSVDF